MEASNNHIRNIAIVGASGNVGATVLKHLLLASNKFHITILTRSDSSATFPSSPSITIKKGSYSDTVFLHSALHGNDAVILALGFSAMEQQPALIEAAAKAGVRWILPTEFSASGHATEVTQLPLYVPKVEARKQIEALSARKSEEKEEVVNWIAIVTNPWTEFSVNSGLLGLNIGEQKFTHYEDGGYFNTSTMEQVGRGTAALLSLPIENTEKPRASLKHYANGYAYVSSFLTSQQDLFDAAVRATGTTKADWSVEESSIWGKGGKIEQAEESVRQGDWRGSGYKLYAYYMSRDKGGDYEVKAKEDREILGLQEEDLDQVMKTIVDAAAWVRV